MSNLRQKMIDKLRKMSYTNRVWRDGWAGRRRTIGNRVGVSSVSGVRIPLSSPKNHPIGWFFYILWGDSKPERARAVAKGSCGAFCRWAVRWRAPWAKRSGRRARRIACNTLSPSLRQNRQVSFRYLSILLFHSSLFTFYSNYGRFCRK